MISYQQSIDTIKSEIESLKHHLDILGKYPPGLYQLDQFHAKSLLVLTSHYRTYSKNYRNKISCNVIATEEVDLLPFSVGVCLGTLPNINKMVPVDIKDLPLYIGWGSKSAIFEKILRTGKLPKNQRAT